tara:strand:- start:398 stop:559 length:162 start_codon:yes stop_codon:yes gene_type:complete
MGCGYSIPEGIRDEIIEKSRINEYNLYEIKEVINCDNNKNIEVSNEIKNKIKS